MNLKLLWFWGLFLLLCGCVEKKTVYFCGSEQSEVFQLLKDEGFKLERFDSPEAMIEKATNGSAAVIICDTYPVSPLKITQETYKLAQQKKIKVYLEYPDLLPDMHIEKETFHASLERGVITCDKLENLKPMDIIGINDCYTRVAKVDDPLIVLARVAGFDQAEYGIEDVESYPLLCERENMLIAFTKLSNFRTGRYEPLASWQSIWKYIISFVTDDSDFTFLTEWPSDVKPTYSKGLSLPTDAGKNMISRGLEWFFNGRFFIDSSWKELQLERQGDGLMPVARALPTDSKVGNGTMGILEGHASNIYYDGEQDFRYWLRADVQGEVAFALASGGKLLNNPTYEEVSKNLMEYVLKNSAFRAGKRIDPFSPVYGLIGWSDTHPYVFYADDNARLVLGLIGASAFMGYDRWNKEIVENILANFRLSNVNGFFGNGGRLEESQVMEKGWRYYAKRPELVNPHPHFESWMWACYLWLYDKTGYQPLLEKAEKAIRLTMENYPDGWKWTNGIQQERARMILPLAWLVRVKDTPEHREWLDRVVSRLLENQQASGAIREELGNSSTGTFGKAKSNKEYGVTEAPLISHNGDPVADMLYTSNFAFFSLNEAAKATGNSQYKKAVEKLSDFLIRIQVKSDRYAHLDGAWYRAFDYDRWDYWASNADHGWGAWSTLTGWIQSWIIGTQVLIEDDTSFWDKTKDVAVKSYMDEVLQTMFEN
ncbi:hypothetical protein DXD68_22985 [Parabacteroides sp. TM07-1AC]|uniref:hypothetical protein n=1 Tax=Parabacteroides sp. TM07-1AC TaxID=2292363 RepID=UPI000EFFF238|nr:hypothetical protein [Parabacteroides sp. TM07-1AC]RHU22101.1 hypothetical protein DXD68_22985 [Parabacteroides sp. TM07-1AC]